MNYLNWLNALSNSPAGVAAVFMFLLSCCFLGKAIRKSIDVEYYCFPIVDLVLGMNLAFLFFFTAGILGCINKYTVWGTLISGTSGFMILCVREYLPIVLKQIRNNVGFISFLLILMLFFAAPALCYPVSWDDLTYHLVVPLRWINDGFPNVYHDLPFSGYPSAPEFLFYSLVTVGGITSPAILLWVMFGSVFSLLYINIKRNSGKAVAFVLIAAVILSPSVQMIFKGAYVEAFTLANVLAFLLLNREVAGKWKPGTAVAAGILLGGLCAIKLNGGLIAALFVILIFLTANRSNKLKVILCVVLTIIAVSLPFYLRPWIAIGNPFHPFFASIFSSNNQLLLSSSYHHQMTAAKYGVHNLQGFITAPVLMCFKSRTFDGILGWQYLIVFCLSIISLARLKRQHDSAKKYLLYGVVFSLYTAWFFSAQQTRFILPAVVILLPLCSDVFRIFNNKIKNVVLFLIMLLTLTSTELMSFKNSYNCWKYLLGGDIGLKSFIYSGSGPGYLPAAEIIDKTTPQDANILLLFDYRSLYIPRKTELGTPYLQSKYFTPVPDSADEVIKQCRKNGITHLLTGFSKHNPDRQKKYNTESRKLVALLIALQKQGKIKLLWSGQNFYLYEITTS